MILRLFIILIILSNISYAAQLKTILPEEYYKQNPSKERRAILDFIINQFNNKKISQKDIDRLWSNEKFRTSQHLLRFQIVNQQLYTYSSDVKGLFFLELTEYFKKLLQTYKINDVDFLVYGRDEIALDKNIPALEIFDIPSFMMSKNLNSPYEKNMLLFPDAFMLRKAWKIAYQEIEKANSFYTWDKKINKIFWRGSTTGWVRDKPYDIKSYNLENFSKLDRIKLVILSKLYPDLIDAAFAFYPQFSRNQSGQDLKRILKLLFPQENLSMDKAEHLKYKYLISLDGNTCAWERVPWIMLSNSVLIKQETDNIEWFYSAIKPYIHYIPVNKDLTDLFSKVEWLKQHDKEIEKISQNATLFVQNNLKPEDIDIQMVIALNEYSKIQQDEKIKITLKPVDKSISLLSLIELLIYKKIKLWFNYDY